MEQLQQGYQTEWTRATARPWRVAGQRGVPVLRSILWQPCEPLPRKHSPTQTLYPMLLARTNGCRWLYYVSVERKWVDVTSIFHDSGSKHKNIKVQRLSELDNVRMYLWCYWWLVVYFIWWASYMKDNEEAHYWLCITPRFRSSAQLSWWTEDNWKLATEFLLRGT